MTIGTEEILRESSGVQCPYIYPGHNDDFICTGTTHIRPKGLKDVPCPFRNEASQWARNVGIKGDFTLDTFNRSLQLKAYEEVLKWVENPNKILLLSSKAGLGKSRLAIGAWYRLKRNGHDCLLCTAQSFLKLSIRATMGNDLDNTLTKFIGEDLLQMDRAYFENIQQDKKHKVPCVFDDLGNERTSDVFIENFGQLLNYREGMLITTNLDLTSIEERYGERISSRLLNADYLWLQGEDMRGQE